MKFRKRAFVVALLAFGAAFAGQLALRAALGNQTLLSPDAVLAVSFGAEALAFLVIGFFVSFLARGFGGREMGYASDLELLFVHDGHDAGDNEFFGSLAHRVVDFIESRDKGSPRRCGSSQASALT